MTGHIITYVEMPDSRLVPVTGTCTLEELRKAATEAFIDLALLYVREYRYIGIVKTSKTGCFDAALEPTVRTLEREEFERMVAG